MRFRVGVLCVSCVMMMGTVMAPMQLVRPLLSKPNLLPLFLSIQSNVGLISNVTVTSIFLLDRLFILTLHYQHLFYTLCKNKTVDEGSLDHIDRLVLILFLIWRTVLLVYSRDGQKKYYILLKHYLTFRSRKKKERLYFHSNIKTYWQGSMINKMIFLSSKQ